MYLSKTMSNFLRSLELQLVISQTHMVHLQLHQSSQVVCVAIWSYATQ